MLLQYRIQQHLTSSAAPFRGGHLVLKALSIGLQIVANHVASVRLRGAQLTEFGDLESVLHL